MDTSGKNKYTAANTEAPAGRNLGGPYRQESEEALDPEFEVELWRGTFYDSPYYDPDYTFETYEPAYRFGWQSRSRMIDREWDEAEEELRHEWAKNHEGTLTWERAKEAIRDAWDYITGDDSNNAPRRR